MQKGIRLSMKAKKSILLAVLPLAALLTTTSCSMLGNIIGAVTGEDDGEYVSLDRSLSETKSKIEQLGKNGLEITVKVYEDTDDEKSENSETYGIKGDTRWYLEDNENGIAFSQEGARVHYYNYDKDEGWYYSSSFDADEAEFNELDLMTYWLYYGYTFDGSYKKGGTETVAGRKCDVYTFSVNMIFEKAGYKICIDQETGATLKYTLDAQVIDESARFGFEVTSFVTGNKVKAPELPSPEDNGESNNGGNNSTPSNTTKREVSYASEYDLVSIENEILVCKYVGSSEEYEDDKLFVNYYEYEASSIYFVWTGFNSDGSINQIRGETYFCYFFNDQDKYLNAVSTAKEHHEYRAQNDAVWYMTTSTTAMEPETWEECVETFTTGGDYRHPHFEIVY